MSDRKRHVSTIRLPPIHVMKDVWRGRPDSVLPARPETKGFHDRVLFDPTSPPGHWAFARLRFRLTAQCALSLPGRRILDAAAGACFVAVCLHKAGREVVLNDLRPLAESLQPWGLNGVLEVHQRDIFTLGAAEVGVFDIIVCTELIEHVAHPVELLRHLRSLLRPGGHLILTTPNGLFLGSRLPTFSEVASFDELESRQFLPDSDGHLFLLTPAELDGLLEAAGYGSVDIFEFGAPFTNGHLKFRHLSFLGAAGLWYGLEKAVGFSPSPIRGRLSSHLLACATAV